MWLLEHIVLLSIFPYSFGVKVLQFRHERGEGAATIRNNVGKTQPSNVSFCVDLDLKLVTPSRLLLTTEAEDLDIDIPESLDRFYTKLKGIWYLTPVRDLLSPYSFGTYCMSYDSEQHSVIFAYNGHIIFEKTDPLRLGVSNFSKNFPGNIILGLKDKSKSFTGDITRLNVWSKALTASQLKIKSSCDGMDDSLPEVGDPDLLDWETTEWDIPDGTKIKEIIAYPCSSNQVDLLDVLMPYAAVDLYDAIDTCTVLGGRMGPPDSEEDMNRMIAEAKGDMDKSDCIDYLWIPYHKNNEGEWALFDGTKESLLPEFFKKPPWLEWEKSQPNGLDMEECAMVGISDTFGIGASPLAYDADCIKPNNCFMCEFEDITYFNMRGLCSKLDNILDIQYLVDMDKVSQDIDKGVIWTGYRQSRIMFNKILDRWTITSLSDTRPILTLANKVRKVEFKPQPILLFIKEKLPVGPLIWDTPLNVCGDDKAERKLFLTSCNETEFSCLDGVCIPIQER